MGNDSDELIELGEPSSPSGEVPGGAIAHERPSHRSCNAAAHAGPTARTPSQRAEPDNQDSEDRATPGCSCRHRGTGPAECGASPGPEACPASTGPEGPSSDGVPHQEGGRECSPIANASAVTQSAVVVDAVRQQTSDGGAWLVATEARVPALDRNPAIAA